jgi:hypothetical protein
MGSNIAMSFVFSLPVPGTGELRLRKDRAKASHRSKPLTGQRIVDIEQSGH